MVAIELLSLSCVSWVFRAVLLAISVGMFHFIFYVSSITSATWRISIARAVRKGIVLNLL